MNLFSLYITGDTVLHRLGVGWKYLLLLALTMPAMLIANPVASVAALLASLGLLASCRAGLRYSWGLPIALWVLVGVLAGYQALVGRPDLAVVVGTNLITAV